MPMQFKTINVYNGMDGSTALIIKYYGSPLDLSAVTRMRCQLLGSTIELDSNLEPDAIKWDSYGRVVMRLGGLGVTGERGFKLIAYDDGRPSGQVIVSSYVNNIRVAFYSHD